MSQKHHLYFAVDKTDRSRSSKTMPIDRAECNGATRTMTTVIILHRLETAILLYQELRESVMKVHHAYLESLKVGLTLKLALTLILYHHHHHPSFFQTKVHSK